MNKREIKFRAWSKPGNRMIDLHAVTPFALDKDLKQNGVFIPFSDDFVNMQYTNKKDKNKKEIYEGDIMRRISSDGAKDDSEVLCQVLYDDGSFWRQLITTSRPFYYIVTLSSAHFHDEKWEIIGNIYQNPDLLK